MPNPGWYFGGGGNRQLPWELQRQGGMGVTDPVAAPTMPSQSAATVAPAAPASSGITSTEPTGGASPGDSGEGGPGPSVGESMSMAQSGPFGSTFGVSNPTLAGLAGNLVGLPGPASMPFSLTQMVAQAVAAANNAANPGAGLTSTHAEPGVNAHPGTEDPALALTSFPGFDANTPMPGFAPAVGGGLHGFQGLAGTPFAMPDMAPNPRSGEDPDAGVSGGIPGSDVTASDVSMGLGPTGPAPDSGTAASAAPGTASDAATGDSGNAGPGDGGGGPSGDGGGDGSGMKQGGPTDKRPFGQRPDPKMLAAKLKAHGGTVTKGSKKPGADDVPVRLSKGEFVEPKQTVDQFGPLLEKLRQHGLRGGMNVGMKK